MAGRDTLDVVVVVQIHLPQLKCSQEGSIFRIVQLILAIFGEEPLCPPLLPFAKVRKPASRPIR